MRVEGMQEGKRGTLLLVALERRACEDGARMRMREGCARDADRELRGEEERVIGVAKNNYFGTSSKAARRRQAKAK